MVMKLSELYHATRKALLSRENPSDAGFIARNLICHATGYTSEQILAKSDLYVGDDICEAVQKDTQRILSDEPLAYVLGEWEFYGIPLYVDSRVLIPRDDTCAVTDLAVRKAIFLDSSPRILDLCTGSGCIGIAIASKIPDAKVTLADISKDALTVAKKNVTRNHLSGRIAVVQSDALGKPSAFLGKFDMIVSNPPYITSSEMEELPQSVSEFEPHLALFGGSDGLDFYRSIIDNYTDLLKPGGFIAFEFGFGQGDAVCSLLSQKGYEILERSRDYNDRERAVIAQYGRKEE